MFGVADKGVRGVVWVAFTLCGESFVEGGYRKEEDPGVNNVGEGE